MLKKHTGLIILLAAAFSIRAFAQDFPTYVLAQAFKTTNGNGINILFGKNFPKDSQGFPVCAGSVAANPCYLAGTGSAFASKKWLIQAFDLTTGNPVEKTLSEVQVFPQIKTVRLILSDGVDVDSFKYVIAYREANIPNVTLGQPAKSNVKKAFVPAKGKSDADLYFKGSATASHKNSPVYSIEAKFGYLQSLKENGAIGGKFSLVSDEQSNVDPDSITASASYQKIFVFQKTKGIIFNSDFFGGEFNKKNTTQNLTTGADATLVLPSVPLGKMTFFTADFMVGFDAGHNYKHSLNPNGLGGFWRPKLGFNTYLLALETPLFNRVSLNTEYKLRLPRSSEPFTEKINGTEVTSLTRRPRHYFGADLNLLFTDAYGIAVSYRYGSLPPAFNLVEHKVSIGLVVQFKQANK